MIHFNYFLNHFVYTCFVHYDVKYPFRNEADAVSCLFLFRTLQGGIKLKAESFSLPVTYHPPYSKRGNTTFKESIFSFLDFVRSNFCRNLFHRIILRKSGFKVRVFHSLWYKLLQLDLRKSFRLHTFQSLLIPLWPAQLYPCVRPRLPS